MLRETGRLWFILFVNSDEANLMHTTKNIPLTSGDHQKSGWLTHETHPENSYRAQGRNQSLGGYFEESHIEKRHLTF